MISTRTKDKLQRTIDERENFYVNRSKNFSIYEERTLNESELSGITLLALVVTIIVLLILAGVTISTINSNNGVLTQAKKATITSDLSKYKEEVELYKASKQMEGTEKKTADGKRFEATSLNANYQEKSLVYNTQDGNETGDITTIIPDLKKDYHDGKRDNGEISVTNGQMVFKSTNDELYKIAQDLGIEVDPYNVKIEKDSNGKDVAVLTSSDKNLLLMSEDGTVTLPYDIDVIDQGTFSNVKGLKRLIIPYTVKTIRMNAFYNNNELEEVIFQTKDGQGCTEIGRYAFGSCTSLKKVQLPETLIKLGGGAFAYSGIESMDVPGSVFGIESMVFYGCNLKEIKLNEGTESISGWGAIGANLITDISLPSSITYIGTGVFSDHNHLINIDTSKNSNFTYENGTLMNSSKTNILFISSAYYSDNNTYTIAKGVTDTFCSLPNNIETLEIPESLTNLYGTSKNIKKITIDPKNKTYSTYNNGKQLYKGNELVRSFSNEENISVKDGTQVIDLAAFGTEMNAKIITLADSVTKLNGYILPQASKNLTKLVLGKNVKDIDGEFALNSFNVQIEISSENNYVKNVDGVIYSKDGTKLISAVTRIQGSFTVPKGVTIIGNNPFRGQAKMTELILPEGVKSIGNQIFTYDVPISKLEIPSSVKTIDYAAFNSSTLKEIHIKKKQGTISGSPWSLSIGERGIFWEG